MPYGVPQGAFEHLTSDPEGSILFYSVIELLINVTLKSGLFKAFLAEFPPPFKFHESEKRFKSPNTSDIFGKLTSLVITWSEIKIRLYYW